MILIYVLYSAYRTLVNEELHNLFFELREKHVQAVLFL